MSKYGIVIIIILLITVIGFSAWQVLSGESESPIISSNENEEKPLGVSFSDDIEKYIIDLSLDKKTYAEKDIAYVEVKIMSNEDISNIFVEIEGLENNLGKKYIFERKEISLEKSKENIIKYEKQLPTCSSCSGFREGEYEIEARILRNDYVLASDKVDINLKAR